jgi:hypothetical protein
MLPKLPHPTAGRHPVSHRCTPHTAEIPFPVFNMPQLTIKGDRMGTDINYSNAII